jgi:hypothetical protein
MKALLFLSILAIAAMPARMISASAEVLPALSYLSRCSPSAYQFVLANVNMIEVIGGSPTAGGGAHFNPSGKIIIAAYLFEHPEIYFPDNDAMFHLSDLIVHEARHEWQYSHWGSVFLRYDDPAIRTLMENDANDFAAASLATCH